MSLTKNSLAVIIGCAMSTAVSSASAQDRDVKPDNALTTKLDTYSIPTSAEGVTQTSLGIAASLIPKVHEDAYLPFTVGYRRLYESSHQQRLYDSSLGWAMIGIIASDKRSYVPYHGLISLSLAYETLGYHHPDKNDKAVEVLFNMHGVLDEEWFGLSYGGRIGGGSRTMDYRSDERPFVFEFDFAVPIHAPGSQFRFGPFVDLRHEFIDQDKKDNAKVRTGIELGYDWKYIGLSADAGYVYRDTLELPDISGMQMGISLMGKSIFF